MTPNAIEAAISRLRRRIAHLGLTITSIRNVGYVMTGAGMLGVAAGAYFGVRTIQKKGDRDGQCQLGCTFQGIAYDQEARTSALRSTVWVGTGVAALLTGVALLWVSRSHTVHERAGQLRLLPEVGPDRAGVGLGGSW